MPSNEYIVRRTNDSKSVCCNRQAIEEKPSAAKESSGLDMMALHLRTDQQVDRSSTLHDKPATEIRH
jgi:hypothetical protein